MLSVAEYGRIFRDEVDESLPAGNLRLTRKHFDALHIHTSCRLAVGQYVIHML